MNRRQFFGVAGGGFVASLALSGPRHAMVMKNWAWMKSEIKDVDAWRRDLSRLKAAGFDAILMTGTAESYQKAVPTVRQEGLELHAWLFTMMRGENVEAHPEWYAVNRNGVSTAQKPPYVDYYKFMCPSRLEVQAYLRGVVGQLASVDGVASIHLDYIRYPDVILPVALWPKYKLVQDKEYAEFDFCYCDVCRARFQKTAGVDPKQLPDPSADRAWLQYRYDSITEAVAQLADVVHRSGKILTAAVFPTPAIAKKLVRQEWTKWNVDAVLPMTYNGFYKENVAWIERATREGVTALAGRIPLYAGLYVPDLRPPELALAIRRATAGGASGISVFQGDMLTAEYLQAVSPVLRAGRQ